MKNILTSISLLFISIFTFGQQKVITVAPTYLKGLYNITFSSANVNDICEAEGIIAFATQIGVELYLENRIIGTYTYQLLTSSPHNNRVEIVCIATDTIDHRILVMDKKGIGQIDYNKGLSSNIIRFDTAIDFSVGVSAIKQKFDSYRIDKKVQSLLIKKLQHQTDALYQNTKQAITFIDNDLYLDGILLYSLPSKIWDVEVEKFSSNDSLLNLLVLTNRDGLYRLTMGKHSSNALIIQQLRIELLSGIGIQNLRNMEYLDKWDVLAIGLKIVLFHNVAIGKKWQVVVFF